MTKPTWAALKAAVTVLGLFCALSAAAKTISIEFLQGVIDPQSEGELGGLACRNYDHIVHVDITVIWSGLVVAEQSDYQRLVFWTDRDSHGFATEYLFPKGSYSFLHGSYIVKGYFIVRSGGMPQGSHLLHSKE